MATGVGQPMVGLGLLMSRGVGFHITMDVGFGTVDMDGFGSRATPGDRPGLHGELVQDISAGHLYHREVTITVINPGVTSAITGRVIHHERDTLLILLNFRLDTGQWSRKSHLETKILFP